MESSQDSFPHELSLQEADEELSVDEEYVQDCVEYVHFGKGLEYDRERWIWKKDVDFESEIKESNSTKRNCDIGQ
ncbi:hypothetical protein PENSUB_309 [Penicillium subrubescens]|uniref:Uncharacterized protein n=1 Tax=Penicillium subrubescens TaxID=1316194 RepID=A0A1Q5UNJ1_9EURO|nr:hypothetical protein PENSUB_309 [Penicillium subrubescens]